MSWFWGAESADVGIKVGEDKPTETNEFIWLLYMGGGQWVWSDEPDPSTDGEFTEGVNSIKYKRCDT